MCYEDGTPVEEEEITVDLKLINEMKHLMNENTKLRTELLMTRLLNVELKNEIKEQKQKLNAVYGKKEK